MGMVGLRQVTCMNPDMDQSTGTRRREDPRFAQQFSTRFHRDGSSTYAEKDDPSPAHNASLDGLRRRTRASPLPPHHDEVVRGEL
ncbi:hypothetical protein VTN96DRAFT_3220 [Rasamsonia emersonii]